MDKHCLLVKVSHPDLKWGLVVFNLEMLEKGDNLWFTSRTYEAAVVTQHWALGKESFGVMATYHRKESNLGLYTWCTLGYIRPKTESKNIKIRLMNMNMIEWHFFFSLDKWLLYFIMIIFSIFFIYIQWYGRCRHLPPRGSLPLVPSGQKITQAWWRKPKFASFCLKDF